MIETQQNRPFREFVVKTTSRCNLNCTYCYMYNLGDQSFMQQPRFIPDSYAEILASRIIEHCIEHKQYSIVIVLHGGEPLLMGKERMSLWVTTLRDRFSDKNIDVQFAVQTNGTLIDHEWVDLLADLRVSVGISLDGPKEFHDVARITHRGEGSFDITMDGINTLQQHPRGSEVFQGVLSVINPNIPPEQMWNFIETSSISSFDLRLPIATHDTVIPFTDVQLSDWLIYLFDKWFYSNKRLSIRMFDSILLLYFNSDAVLDESLGTGTNDLIIIESNGGIEPSDNLKPCGEGFTKINHNILNNSFTDVLSHPLIQLSRKQTTTIHDKCLHCDFFEICGGGHLTERYSLRNGFKNPSVYCGVYLEFYNHAVKRIEAAMPIDMIESLKNRDPLK